MKTALMLAALYGRTSMTLQEVVNELGISYNTAKNHRSQGIFPVPMAGHPLMASVEDVAKVLDARREQAV